MQLNISVYIWLLAEMRDKSERSVFHTREFLLCQEGRQLFKIWDQHIRKTPFVEQQKTPMKTLLNALIFPSLIFQLSVSEVME